MLRENLVREKHVAPQTDLDIFKEARARLGSVFFIAWQLTYFGKKYNRNDMSHKNYL